MENSPGGSPLDVRVDGLLVHRWTGGPGRHRIAFALPAGGARPAEAEVWLPHLSATRIAAVSLSGHRSPPAAVDRPGARWVVYGSSIVHCMYAAGPSETWPALVAAERGWRLRNLGLAGEAHLDPLLARTIRDAPADLITLELGINAYIRGGFTARTWGPAVCGFVETVRDGHPDTPVVVLTSLAAPGREQAVNSAGMTLVETRAARLAGSVSRTKSQRCRLRPVGAWAASRRHSSIRARSTGRSRSRRLRTARVVVRTSSAVRSSGGMRLRPYGGRQGRRSARRYGEIVCRSIIFREIEWVAIVGESHSGEGG